MKLIKCYVYSFGKLKDFSYDFNENLNVIKEDNGFGKTTLATFLKSMFYGLSGSNKHNLTENERAKYKPWNSTEKFGGYVIFERDGREYKIERYFGNKENDDSTSVIDNLTGKPFSNVENFGRRLFGIDEDGFLSTTFFSQQKFEVKSNTSITEKFNELCEISTEVNYDTAVKILTDKSKQYKYSGNRGIIPELKSDVLELTDKIETIKNNENAVNKLLVEKIQLEKDLAVLKTEREELSSQIFEESKKQSLIIKKETVDRLTNQKEKILVELDGCEQVLKGLNPTDQQIEYANKQFIEMSVQRNSILTLNEVITELEKNTYEKPNKKTNKSLNSLILGFLGLVFAVIGCILYGKQFIASVVCFAISLVLICFAVFKYAKSKKDLKTNDRTQESQSLLQSKIAEREQKIELVNNVNVTITKFLANFNLPRELDVTQKLNLIKKKRDDRERLVMALKEVEKELDDVLDQQLKEFISAGDFTVKNISSLNLRLRLVGDEYAVKTKELSEKVASINRYEEDLETFNRYIGLKEEKEEQLKIAESELKTYSETLRFLGEANENLKIKYRKPLLESLNNFSKYITGDMASELEIDVDFNLTVNEKSGAKKVEYYSRGMQDMFNICKRFALVDVLFKREKPFIILDDPFYNLDDGKIKTALELIENLSKDYQIIYLVCHNSRVKR